MVNRNTDYAELTFVIGRIRHFSSDAAVVQSVKYGLSARGRRQVSRRWRNLVTPPKKPP
jgi:hypothetical protein